MSSLAGNSTSPIWQNMEGNTVNAVFPLLRFLGGSDHSGVFLTQVEGRTPAEVAVKIVPLIPTFAELQLARWREVAGLAHPHLLRLFEAGRCEIGGMPYLYALMERADQSLAELLKNRALTEEEARQTLLPALSALAYLHSSELVHGQLKPSNVLVVGDQLKLASDTVHPVAEYSVGVNGMSAYDPPEARNGNSSTAGDIWALGVTMCEALTLQKPSGLHVGSGDPALPADIPPAFREIVAFCLRLQPEERPSLAALQVWLGGEPGSAPATTSAPASGKAVEASDALVPEAAVTNKAAPPSTFKLTIRAEVLPEDEHFTAEPLQPKWRVLRLAVAAVAVLAVVWIGIAFFRSDRTAAPTAGAIPAQPRTSDAAPQAAPGAARDARPETVPRAAGGATPSAPREMPPSQPGSAGTGASGSVDASAEAAPLAVHEVLPDIPQSALNTIRGTIRVSVRVILDKQGTVISASADDPGPSAYFARKALGAAKQWTFPPADSDAQRVMTVRFAFKRSGTSALAAPPR